MRSALLFALVLGGCAARPLDFVGAGGGDTGGNGNAGGGGGGNAGGGGGNAGGGELQAPDMSYAAHDLAGPDLSGPAPDAGTGFYQPAPIDLPLPSTFAPHAVAVADFTGDGRNDIVIAASAPDGNGQQMAVVIYAQTAAGGLAAPVSYLAGGNSSGISTMIAVADFDGDGRLDVALTTYSDLRILLQTPSGGLGAPRILLPSYIYEDPELLVSGDFDGDGRADLVWAGWDSTHVDVWYQADGFAAPHSFDCPHSGSDSIATADFNGDGKLDIAISSLEGSTLCRIDQQPGGFSAPTTSALTEQPPVEAIAAGDLDGDGRPDIVAIGGGNIDVDDRYVDLLHQNDDGSFSLGSRLTPDWYPSGVLIADIDGDGLGDVVVAHELELEVGICLQLPGGGLAPEQTYKNAGAELTEPGAQLTAAGDVNGDGKPDIVTVETSLWVLYHR